MLRENFTKEEVIAAIERKSSSAKIPLVFHKWWGIGLKEKYKEELNKMADKYPDDIFVSFYDSPGMDKSNNKNPEYRWGYCDYDKAERHSIGNITVLLSNWDDLELLFNKFPDSYESDSFDSVKKALTRLVIDINWVDSGIFFTKGFGQ